MMNTQTKFFSDFMLSVMKLKKTNDRLKTMKSYTQVGQ
jgi:hypothetical protein